MAPPRRLLVVSNGIGEDSIAAAIIRRLPSSIVADAYPTLGDGAAYRGVCPIVGPRTELASKGSRAYRGALLRDILTGVLFTIRPSLDFLREAAKTYDRIVVVGDLLMIIACRMAGLTGVTYVDVYRSGYERGYWRLEKRLMRRVCKTVFCRSEALATSLRAAGIDARAAGNVMMDTIPYGNYDAAARRFRKRAVTLLPGSRQTTLDNFRLQAGALKLLSDALVPDVFLALADGVDPDALAKISGLRFTPPMSGGADAGSLGDGRMTIRLARGVLGNLLEVSDLVMSQAGTATIQSIGMGKPAITFRARRNRDARIKGISALYGDARLLIPPTSETAAEALKSLLSDDEDRLRRGAIGRERIGSPGAIEAIIRELSS